MNIEEILKSTKTIAVVGLSDKPERPSYNVANYLLGVGYRIIPINPNISEWNGLKAYGSLTEAATAGEKFDVVDIFRKSDDVLPIVKEAIAVKAKTVWLQLGIINEEAAKLAREAGLSVVMDRCMKIEHARMEKHY